MNPYVLVVDDDEASLALTAKQLERLGYASETIRGGTELPASVANSASLVLIDCQMPVHSGFDVTRAIRHHESGGSRHVPIVAMTADATMANRTACLAAGMDDVLTKPVSFEQLNVILTRWLPQYEITESEFREQSGPLPGQAPGEWLRGEVGDDEAVVRIIRLYADALEERLRRIRGALDHGDAAELAAAAHALRGPSELVGAGDVAAGCRKIEVAGRAGDLARAAPAVGALEQEAGRFRKELAAAFP
jgi:CheY-like chemotaxis protein